MLGPRRQRTGACAHHRAPISWPGRAPRAPERWESTGCESVRNSFHKSRVAPPTGKTLGADATCRFRHRPGSRPDASALRKQCDTRHAESAALPGVRRTPDYIGASSSGFDRCAKLRSGSPCVEFVAAMVIPPATLAIKTYARGRRMPMKKGPRLEAGPFH